MNNTFFISDTHFGHENIIKYCNRPFKNTYDMDNTIIDNWNNTVKSSDNVFFLGDFSFKSKSDTINIICKLKGNITFIKGNHDKNSFFYKQHFIKFPIIFKDFFMLSHKPLFMNDTMPYCNIHGHLHNNKLKSNKFFNVSVECIDYKPISFDQIISIIKI